MSLVINVLSDRLSEIQRALARIIVMPFGRGILGFSLTLKKEPGLV